MHSRSVLVVAGCPVLLIPGLQAGQDVLICDCGGGTVDITTYTIVETTPRLEFEEVVVGNGK